IAIPSIIAYNIFNKKIELISLEKNNYLLGIIAYTSPMIGLLGTVTGMIEAFGKIPVAGHTAPYKYADSNCC
ncbi:MAG: MotA/TolQ/ExbB proton channel family protein, partial [Shewanella sp.]